jgi:hypothetical protein
LERLLPLDLENLLKMTVYVPFLSDDLMDSNYIWCTDVSWRDAGVLILIFFFFFFEGGIAFSYMFSFLRTAETISLNLGRNEILMILYKCCCISK